MTRYPAFEFRNDPQSDEVIPMQFETQPLDAENLAALKRLMAWGKPPGYNADDEDVPF